jgi:hypothetical protein
MLDIMLNTSEFFNHLIIEIINKIVHKCKSFSDFPYVSGLNLPKVGFGKSNNVSRNKF